MARLIPNCEGVGLIMRELGGDFVTIGRAPSNQIVVDHPSVSAQHAVLLRTGISYSLKDLNSTNGTQINGDCVTDAELKDGDSIRFGSRHRDFCRSLSQTVFKSRDSKVLEENFNLREPKIDCLWNCVRIVAPGAAGWMNGRVGQRS